MARYVLECFDDGAAKYVSGRLMLAHQGIITLSEQEQHELNLWVVEYLARQKDRRRHETLTRKEEGEK